MLIVWQLYIQIFVIFILQILILSKNMMMVLKN
jgi:hypothetical protein